MKITNRHGLPRTLVNLAERDDYTRGNARISVTELINPPRIAILRKRHHAEIERDVSSLLWALVGRALHQVAEAGADEEHIPEERCFADVQGWVVSGAMDIHRPRGSVGILDYKFTGAWAVSQGKPEWEAQLNCYAWLLRAAKGLEAERLEVCAFIRDWQRWRADKDQSYPQVPVQIIPIRVWPAEEQSRYVTERVTLHQTAAAQDAMDEDLIECTDEERWKRGKNYMRCQNYCEVSQWCSQVQGCTETKRG